MLDCPAMTDQKTEPTIELELDSRPRDLGGFSVRRILPSAARKMVGPFIFVDHMGPAVLDPGDGLDVRPHPHINLATVTYLFEGEILHRDSLGSVQVIQPGAVNWMTAGRGIVHSERSPDAARKTGSTVHGIQLWVALPKEHEEDEPTFVHHPAKTIPELSIEGVRVRVVAGSAYEQRSPANALSQLFYVEAQLNQGSELALPSEHRERAVYVVGGAISPKDSDAAYTQGHMIVFREGVDARIVARERSHVMLLGGAPLDGQRHIWWNFVSSSQERLERAKKDWKERKFGTIPGDDEEFIPLPEP